MDKINKLVFMYYEWIKINKLVFMYHECEELKL